MTHDQSQIRSLDGLHNLFEAQVELDNDQFGITSLYLPNPIFTMTPKYCLVAMEPSWGRQTLESFRDIIKRGFRNFVGSPTDSILQYCAYKFLCDEAFDYQITDISKGAMKTTVASSQRSVRYANWLNALKQELRFFGNPSLIAVGSSANHFLNKAGLEVSCTLPHFSQQNSGLFRKYYERHPEQGLADGIHVTLREFVEQMMAELNYDLEMRDAVLKKLYAKELSVWKRGMFLNYKDLLSETAAGVVAQMVKVNRIRLEQRCLKWHNYLASLNSSSDSAPRI